MTTKYPDVTVQLSGNDGNAFAIVGACCKAARRAKVSSEEIERFTTECTSGGRPPPANVHPMVSTSAKTPTAFFPPDKKFMNNELTKQRVQSPERNRERGARAEAALNAYFAHAGELREDARVRLRIELNLPTVRAHDDYADVVDLITDCLHFARLAALPIDSVLPAARNNFEAELAPDDRAQKGGAK
jgi:hypothetical protein